MWAELADTVQALFDQQVSPVLSRLRGMTSTFTMAEEDLVRRVDDLGPFFSLSNRVEIEDWPLALMQRQDEIHLKKTDYPIVSTINREFTGMKVEWQPLWAPIDQEAWPYGTRFTTKEWMPFEDIPPEGWFMTARGVIKLPVDKLRGVFPLLQTVDEQTTEFESILRRLVEPLIPLHIVYDGAQYYIAYILAEADEQFAAKLYDLSQVSPPAREGLDSVTAITAITDTYPPINNQGPYLYSYQARLDAFRFDAWTIDKPLPGAPE
ncbi:hypothetical protein ACEUCJ_15190 [Aeromonas rivipollensis]|uniref:hypothetical protein n=1 Tax=Aeromonas rivipollensis TaxID=948519 RepID=UPI0038D1E390